VTNLILASLAVVIVAVWGSRTLTEPRFGRGRRTSPQPMLRGS